MRYAAFLFPLTIIIETVCSASGKTQRRCDDLTLYKNVNYNLKSDGRLRRQTPGGYQYIPKGWFTSQSHSRYNLGAGGSKEPARAESESSLYGSKAIVRGTNGEGQVQSNTQFESICEECAPGQRGRQTKTYVPGQPQWAGNVPYQNQENIRYFGQNLHPQGNQNPFTAGQVGSTGTENKQQTNYNPNQYGSQDNSGGLTPQQNRGHDQPGSLGSNSGGNMPPLAYQKPNLSKTDQSNQQPTNENNNRKAGPTYVYPEKYSPWSTPSFQFNPGGPGYTQNGNRDDNPKIPNTSDQLGRYPVGSQPNTFNQIPQNNYQSKETGNPYYQGPEISKPEGTQYTADINPDKQGVKTPIQGLNIDSQTAHVPYYPGNTMQTPDQVPQNFPSGPTREQNPVPAYTDGSYQKNVPVGTQTPLPNNGWQTNVNQNEPNPNQPQNQYPLNQGQSPNYFNTNSGKLTPGENGKIDTQYTGNQGPFPSSNQNANPPNNVNQTPISLGDSLRPTGTGSTGVQQSQYPSQIGPNYYPTGQNNIPPNSGQLPNSDINNITPYQTSKTASPGSPIYDVGSNYPDYGHQNELKPINNIYGSGPSQTSSGHPNQQNFGDKPLSGPQNALNPNYSTGLITKQPQTPGNEPATNYVGQFQPPNAQYPAKLPTKTGNYDFTHPNAQVPLYPSNTQYPMGNQNQQTGHTNYQQPSDNRFQPTLNPTPGTYNEANKPTGLTPNYQGQNAQNPTFSGENIPKAGSNFQYPNIADGNMNRNQQGSNIPNYNPNSYYNTGQYPLQGPGSVNTPQLGNPYDHTKHDTQLPNINQISGEYPNQNQFNPSKANDGQFDKNYNQYQGNYPPQYPHNYNQPIDENRGLNSQNIGQPGDQQSGQQYPAIEPTGSQAIGESLRKPDQWNINIQGNKYPNNLRPGEENGEESSQANANISRKDNETSASAFAVGWHKKGKAETVVSGSYFGAASFSAQANIIEDGREAHSQVQGGPHGAISGARGRGGNSMSQANVQLEPDSGSILTGALTGGLKQETDALMKGSYDGGMSNARADGAGGATSRARIEFAPPNPREEAVTPSVPFSGSGVAEAQGNPLTGKSQTQLNGNFKYGISYDGAAQAHANYNKRSSQLLHDKYNPENVIGQSGVDYVPEVQKKTWNTDKGYEKDALLTNPIDIPDQVIDSTDMLLQRPDTLVVDSKLPKDERKQSTLVVPLLNEDFLSARPSPQPPRKPSIDLSKTYEAGEEVPGTNGYKIPVGFRGRIKPINEVNANDPLLRPDALGHLNKYTPVYKNQISTTFATTISQTVDGNPKGEPCGFLTYHCYMVYGPNGRTQVCTPIATTTADGVQC